MVLCDIIDSGLHNVAWDVLIHEQLREGRFKRADF